MDVHVLNRQRRRRVGLPGIESFVKRLAREVVPRRGKSLSVCLVSDRRMRELNRRFRGRGGTTDVLSFPAGDGPDPEGEAYLGDVVISVDRAAAQARELGHSLAREIRILALHGYLHLLGYDHETDDGTMMRLQRRLTGRLLGTAGAGRPAT